MARIFDHKEKEREKYLQDISSKRVYEEEITFLKAENEKLKDQIKKLKTKLKKQK